MIKYPYVNGLYHPFLAKMGMVDPFMLYSHYHELHWSWNGSQTSHRFLTILGQMNKKICRVSWNSNYILLDLTDIKYIKTRSQPDQTMDCQLRHFEVGRSLWVGQRQLGTLVKHICQWPQLGGSAKDCGFIPFFLKVPKVRFHASNCDLWNSLDTFSHGHLRSQRPLLGHQRAGTASQECHGMPHQRKLVEKCGKTWGL